MERFPLTDVTSLFSSFNSFYYFLKKTVKRVQSLEALKVSYIMANAYEVTLESMSRFWHHLAEYQASSALFRATYPFPSQNLPRLLDLGYGDAELAMKTDLTAKNYWAMWSLQVYEIEHRRALENGEELLTLEELAVKVNPALRVPWLSMV
jgi:hypothetical protein